MHGATIKVTIQNICVWKNPENYLDCQIFITVMYKVRSVKYKAISVLCLAVCSIIKPNTFFPVVQQLNSGVSCLILRFLDHTLLDTHTHTLLDTHTHTHTLLDTHTHTHTHTQYDSSERVTSSSQKWLPTQHTTYTKDEYKCPQRDSNSLSRWSNGCHRPHGLPEPNIY